MTFEPGDKLCSCTLLVKCGEGSYGEVWLAENAIGGRVALKILKKKFSEREIRGLQNYKDCDHPNLLKIRHIEISDDFVCYTMDAADDLNNGKGDYLPDTLANRLNKYGRLDGKEITAMLDGVLDGLEELHKHGLVHRDIKPDNILWVNGRATLADAGLIASTGQHTLVGTPGFVSPRLLESGGVAETSDDFYALSKVVYCALTGLAPAEYPTIPPEMTISLDPVISKATRVGCSQEVKSSAEFKKLITGKIESVPQQKKAEPPKFTIVEVRKSSVPWIVAFGILALILGAVVFWIIKTEYSHFREQKKAQEEFGNTVVPEYKFPDWKSEFETDRRERAKEYFNRFGLLTGSYFQELLTREMFDKKSIEPEIKRLKALHWADGTGHIWSDFETTLFYLQGTPDGAKVRERQQYWRSQPGTPREIASRMLFEDPVMQMVAVNMLLERLCRHVLTKQEFGGQNKEDIEKLIGLQEDFTDPVMGKLRYMSRKQAETYKK